jgi:hypothetical protein
MNIPPYWAKESFADADRRGRQQSFTASGWSFRSFEEARTEARARAKRIFDLVTSGQRPKEYEYCDRPIREEIVETIDVGSGQSSLITRNRYGALVLNTSQVFFADVDCPKALPGGLWEGLLWLFSPKIRKRKRELLREQTLSRVKDWGIENPGHTFRVYHTHSGLRLLFVDKTYDPGSEEVSRILSELGSDPLYKKLTKKQQCFRARLTAKPWRCGASRPPCSYPWGSSDDERDYRRWEEEYTDVCTGFMTCALLSEYDSTSSDPVIRQVIEVHDNRACNRLELPLA